MGIYGGRVDVLEKYDYTAAVMRSTLETALQDESAQINVPKGVLHKAKNLFEIALSADDPNAKTHPLEAATTYHMATVLLCEALNKEYKQRKTVVSKLGKLLELTQALETGKIDSAKLKDYQLLQRFFDRLRNKSERCESSRFHLDTASEFSYQLY